MSIIQAWKALKSYERDRRLAEQWDGGIGHYSPLPLRLKINWFFYFLGLEATK